MTVSPKTIDFTGVKEISAFRPVNLPEGDYAATVIKVEDVKAKADGADMWLFHIQPTAHKNAIYPYYCKLVDSQAWKVRNLLIACGNQVPKKRVKVNPEVTVGKTIGITLEDDEYDGKMRSTVVAVFPASEMPPADTSSHESPATTPSVGTEDDDELNLEELELDEI